jgi:hypothetical protein
VAAGANTVVALSLTNVLYTITGTQTVAVNSPYSVTVTGDTGSSMVQPLSLGYSGYWPAGITASAQTLGQAWSVTVGATAPATAGSTSVKFTSLGAPLVIVDASTTGYAAASAKFIHGLTGTFWNIAPTDGLPGYVSGGYDTTIAIGSALVNFSTGGITTTLTWGAGR